MGKVQRKVTRKQMRKRDRQLKKAKKDRFFRRTTSDSIPDQVSDANVTKVTTSKVKELKKVKKKKPGPSPQEMRKRHLLDANKLEDRNISSLAKKMKLNRRKSKNLPISFVNDGLDYILEVCDPEKVKQLEVEPELNDSDSDLETVVANVMTGRKITKKNPTANKKEVNVENGDSEASDVELLGEELDSDSSQSESESETETPKNFQRSQQMKQTEAVMKSSKLEKKSKKVQFVYQLKTSPKTEAFQQSSESEELGQSSASDESSFDEADGSSEDEEPARTDIYGRVVDASGKPVPQEKYIPPLRRQAMEDQTASAKRVRLKKQLKGLMNRLSESNLQRIGLQVEELYQSNSRNDMNETLTEIIMESLVQISLTPERLVQEHAVLIALLHANVGVEVGAYFLQTVVNKMESLRICAEGKELNNIVMILSSLYTFKVTHSLLIFDLLNRFADSFEETNLELILIILRTVGFSLRKDNPLVLKEIIIKLQTKAVQSSQHHDQTRMAFMLDCLLAIKNNNFQKIPNYDPTYAEHLKKLLRGITRKGCFGSELRISLQDLLDSDKKGRWWIVGSSWVGKESTNGDPTAGMNRSSELPKANNWNKKILNLAQRQRMNTDIRKSIFCVIMTAEDYLDCYEKLTRLGLRNQQEREIVYVVLDCCLHEAEFNPYYAHLATKLCSEDRKLQMAFQFAIWDHVKELHLLDESKLVNLAQFLSRLLLRKGLSLSVLKVIQFADMDKFVVRFLRHILIGVLLCDSNDDATAVFERISTAPKLHLLREGLRLFMHHLLLNNSNTLGQEIQAKLKTRVKAAESALSALETGVKL